MIIMTILDLEYFPDQRGYPHQKLQQYLQMYYSLPMDVHLSDHVPEQEMRE